MDLSAFQTDSALHLHTETGGQAHKNSGGTIASVEVVTRREDHGSAAGIQPAGRLEPGSNNDTTTKSDRAPESASFIVAG